MIQTAIKSLQQPVSILPLVILRVAFGVLILLSTLRFIANGWVTSFYVTPQFHFTYPGFDWVRPLPPEWMPVVFWGMVICAIGVMAGLAYRPAMACFFVLFTYVELLDQAYYLNHYYFVSVFSLMLVFLPLHRAWSLDVWLRPHTRRMSVPRWMIAVLRWQLTIVYVYAGIAKLEPDWLLHAQPITIWLRPYSDFPVLGALLFRHGWFAYAMSWGGAFYDLTVPFFLLRRRTRWWAYSAVIGFHLATAALFNIGVFPYVMIVATTVFLDTRDYERLSRALRLPIRPITRSPEKSAVQARLSPLVLAGITVFFAFQLLFPLRYLLYPGNHLWTQEGFRFGWRVMLAENTGYVTFRVVDATTARQWDVYPEDYLTAVQTRQMAFQPDMLQQFAHYLQARWLQKGYQVAVYADAYVSLNGRPSQPFIDSTVNLAAQPLSLWHKPWILPLSDDDQD